MTTVGLRDDAGYHGILSLPRQLTIVRLEENSFA